MSVKNNGKPEEKATEKEKDVRRTSQIEREIRAIRKCATVLDVLRPEERTRAVKYLADVYVIHPISEEIADLLRRSDARPANEA